MQTFLPEASFPRTMMILDRQRLGKQRVEAKQILQTLLGESSGWANHPAVKMWRGYEGALALYGLYATCEWIHRGYNDTLREYFLDMANTFERVDRVVYPPWVWDERVHISHRSNLVRKFPGHYRYYYPTVPDYVPYYWPV